MGMKLGEGEIDTGRNPEKETPKNKERDKSPRPKKETEAAGGHGKTQKDNRGN